MDPNRVVVITGVTSGLGRTLARRFCSDGSSVVGCGRRLELGEDLGREILADGGQFVFVQADVARVADCERIIATAIERFGRIDILVNNAGTVGSRPIVDTHEASEEWWDEIVDTNLKGTFFCSRYALAHMKTERSGLIINIASTNAINPFARMQAYNTSKAGVIHLGKGLAVEYREFGIRVNTIILGGVADGASGDETWRAITEYVTGSRPAERPRSSRQMTSDVVASAILELCSDACSIITGATIAIDGAVSAGLLANKFAYAVRPAQA